MQATTIKLESVLLSEIRRVIPKGISLSAFVRKVLESDLQKRKMAEAAEEYARFLEANPDEEKWLTEWEEPDLARPAAGKSQGRKKQ